MSRLAPFPWAEAMAAGLGVLRLPPREFWAMTPRELAAAFEGMGARRGAHSMPRQRLDALMRAYPDRETPNGR